MATNKKNTAEQKEQSKLEVAVDIDGLDLSDLPESLQKKVREKLEKAQANMESRIAKRIEKLVERQTKKSEFEELVADLRSELDKNMALIKQLRSRNKELRAQIKVKKEEHKA